MPNWATSITYHPNGLVNQITHANGVVSTQANDPNRMKRPASITVTKSTSTLFATGAYAYDGSGNVSKIGSDYYLYDTLGRLKEGTAVQAGSSNRQTYGYDGFGNLTSTTSWINGSGTTRTNAVVGTTNRLSAAGYDTAGNQTTWGTYSYTWDLMGMMKAYQGSGNDWAYAYDADDERMFVYNVVTGQSTFRIRGLDGKVLREVKLTGSTWSWGKDWIYRDGQLLATTASGSVTRYAHADHLGSPRLFTDASGNAQERFHYYPFGEQAGTAPTAPEALRFTGHERDSGASTGTADDLDYMHARYYHPQLGRFSRPDPIVGYAHAPGSWNLYAYVRNNPLTYIDPLGLQPDCAFVPDNSESGGHMICGETIDVSDQGSSSSNVTPWRLGWEWLTGVGPRHRYFTDGDMLTELLREHEHVQTTVRAACSGYIDPSGTAPYNLSGTGGIPKYLGDYSTILTGGATGNLAVTYLGSYNLRYSTSGQIVNMTATNKSTAASGLRPPVLGYTPWWNNHVGDPLNEAFSSGPMSMTTQTITLSEPCP